VYYNQQRTYSKIHEFNTYLLVVFEGSHSRGHKKHGAYNNNNKLNNSRSYFRISKPN